MSCRVTDVWHIQVESGKNYVMNLAWWQKNGILNISEIVCQIIKVTWWPSRRTKQFYKDHTFIVNEWLYYTIECICQIITRCAYSPSLSAMPARRMSFRWMVGSPNVVSQNVGQAACPTRPGGPTGLWSRRSTRLCRRVDPCRARAGRPLPYRPHGLYSAARPRGPVGLAAHPNAVGQTGPCRSRAKPPAQ